jgi:hypothetical protein
MRSLVYPSPGLVTLGIAAGVGAPRHSAGHLAVAVDSGNQHAVIAGRLLERCGPSCVLSVRPSACGLVVGRFSGPPSPSVRLCGELEPVGGEPLMAMGRISVATAHRMTYGTPLSAAPYPAIRTLNPSADSSAACVSKAWAPSVRAGRRGAPPIAGRSLGPRARRCQASWWRSRGRGVR